MGTYVEINPIADHHGIKYQVWAGGVMQIEFYNLAMAVKHGKKLWRLSLDAHN
jgi:hypothetical protein